MEVDAPSRSFAATADGKLRYAGGRAQCAAERHRVFLSPEFVLVQKIRFEMERSVRRTIGEEVRWGEREMKDFQCRIGPTFARAHVNVRLPSVRRE